MLSHFKTQYYTSVSLFIWFCYSCHCWWSQGFISWLRWGEIQFKILLCLQYLVCSVYCVWFSVWLGSKILGPQSTGRGWISEEWSYCRDVKIFLEDCVSNLRLLSSSLFGGLTPQMNALSPIQWIFYTLVDSKKLIQPKKKERKRKSNSQSFLIHQSTF